MGKYWWVTWIKVLALTAVFAVVIVLGYQQVKKSVADYLVDAPADAKLTDKLNLEDMVFDYAGEFVDRMMEESEQIRNAITEPLARHPYKSYLLRGRDSAPGAFGLSKKSLAEFALASAKKMEIIFSGGVYVGENTARLANVRRVRRALRAMQRAAAFSNESPVKRVSFESLSKTLF